jgi:hypothetical protein
MGVRRKQQGDIASVLGWKKPGVALVAERSPPLALVVPLNLSWLAMSRVILRRREKAPR